jgi:hypothetical protein
MLRQKPLVLALSTLGLGAFGTAHGAELTLDANCTLADAIASVNAGADQGGCVADITFGYGTSDTIRVAASVTLDARVPFITKDVLITGQGAAAADAIIDGANAYRPFFVGSNASAPTVTLRRLTVQKTRAQGGDGGTGGGGAGAGLGGALFVYDGQVTIEDVVFDGNAAVGGGGGAPGSVSGGGGGGMSGRGGAGGRGGGGGGGFYGAGGDANGGDAEAIGYGGGAGGTAGQAGGAGGGAGGGVVAGAGFNNVAAGGGGSSDLGGVEGSGGLGGNGAGGGWLYGGGGGGGVADSASSGGLGGVGGFGGGGGGGGFSYSNYDSRSHGGAGGFGGGGGNGGHVVYGSAANGGAGGFGGGGGGIATGGTAGVGGAFAGNGGTRAGGGGAGLGGAVFVKSGTLGLARVTFSANSASGGAAGDGTATAGQGRGGALFLCGSGDDASCGATLADSCGVTFATNTATSGDADAYGAVGSATVECAPAAASELVATVQSDTLITLAWSDNSSDEDGFKVYRQEAGGSFGLLATVGADTTSYSDTGLTAGTAYGYYVVAYNTREAPASSSVTATTFRAPLAASELAATAAGATQIDLAWRDNSDNEDGFRVYRQTAGGAFELIATLAADATSYSDTGLVAETQYSYYVVAFNELDAEPSTTATATTSAAPSASPNSSNRSSGGGALGWWSLVMGGWLLRRRTKQ